MPKKLTAQERADRHQYVLNRIRAGVSRTRIEAEFAAEFKCSFTHASRCYREAADSLVCQDPAEQKRNRAVMREMLFSQLAACQNDLLAVQAEVRYLDGLRNQRSLINEQLLAVDARDRVKRLNKELNAIPKFRVTDIAALIEMRVRIRKRLVAIMVEIARVDGLYNEMPWLKAISTLAANEIIPSDIADKMLGVFDDLSASIERAVRGAKAEATSPAMDTDDDFVD